MFHIYPFPAGYKVLTFSKYSCFPSHSPTAQILVICCTTGLRQASYSSNLSTLFVSIKIASSSCTQFLLCASHLSLSLSQAFVRSSLSCFHPLPTLHILQAIPVATGLPLRMALISPTLSFHFRGWLLDMFPTNPPRAKENR